MIQRAPADIANVADGEWVAFPGGELEGTRPRALCPACRARLKALAAHGATERTASRSPLCFQCYRVELDRERALRSAGQLNTASEARFQSALPFEPINLARLERLRMARIAARAAEQSGLGRFTDRRRRAQVAARHALQRIAIGLETRDASGALVSVESDRQRTLAAAAHAAELQLPDAWLPFVVSS
jgi:hypothetical protein